MAQTTTPKLDMGDRFPTVPLALVSGGVLTLPDDLKADQTILLIYRGKW